jgi:hypothetical protein
MWFILDADLPPGFSYRVDVGCVADVSGPTLEMEAACTPETTTTLTTSKRCKDPRAEP